jgi:hypothetical protein
MLAQKERDRDDDADQSAVKCHPAVPDGDKVDRI